MTAITTVAELDALPIDAHVTDDGGYQWWKTAQSGWRAMSDTGISSTRLFELWSPLTLTEAPELRMTRCVTDGCQSAHALPPGSFYACPDHADHITTGGTR